MEADLQSRALVVPGWLRPMLERGSSWAKAAATFGSAGSLAFAAVLGAAAFLAALSIAPPPPAQATPAPKSSAPLTDVSVRPGSLAPVGTPPPPAVQTVLDYEVTYFWPERPQTVAEPTAIRQGPAARTALIRTARPGERLRINGKVVDAPQGPWLRVRLAEGGDGYIQARTVDVAAFRQRRAAEVAATTGEGADVAAASGAPLIPPSPAIAEESELGPPSF